MSDYAAMLDSIAHLALGVRAAPRVNTSILARALALADEACWCDIESYCVRLDRGVYVLTDLNGKRAPDLASADPDTLDKAVYLVDRGLAELQADGDDGPVVVLRLDLLQGAT